MTRYLYDHHSDRFDEILKHMARRVPGVSRVEATETVDGPVVLRFQVVAAFKDPFVSRYVSEGTIKMFAYLVLLHDPAPHPLLCVEEPKNQLYPGLLEELAEEFRAYAGRGGHVLVFLVEELSMKAPCWTSSPASRPAFGPSSLGFSELVTSAA